MPLQPGREKTGGRKKGVGNKLTPEVKSICSAMVSDPDYLKGLEQRLREGKLPPVIEKMLWEYAHGKPKETVEHTGPNGGPIATTVKMDLSKLDVDELEELQRLSQKAQSDNG